MVFESWGTKFGTVVVRDNAKKNSALTILYFQVFSCVMVKVAQKNPKIVKLRPKARFVFDNFTSCQKKNVSQLSK